MSGSYYSPFPRADFKYNWSGCSLHITVFKARQVILILAHDYTVLAVKIKGSSRLFLNVLSSSRVLHHLKWSSFYIRVAIIIVFVRRIYNIWAYRCSKGVKVRDFDFAINYMLLL